MKTAIHLITILTLVTLWTVGHSYADVKPGDVIDKSNYQKVEGLVPDFIVKWVRDGDLTMKIGELTYAPEDFLPEAYKGNANAGKYKVDDNNCIRDVKTNEIPHPHDVKGFPFPTPDVKEPTAPMQMLYNFLFWQFDAMPLKEKQIWFGMNRNRIESRFEMEEQLVIFPKGDKYDLGEVSRFLQPFEHAGVGSMSVYYMDPLKDGLRYVYAPSLGRIKRMSHRLPGSESQFANLDMASDNNWAGGPRSAREEGRYKFLRKQTSLVPYVDKTPAKAVVNKDGEIDVGYGNAGNQVLIGNDVKEWKGAPWHILPLKWVRREMYVFESKSTNPNYRFGPCEGWVEAGTFNYVYKRVTDLNGDLWMGSYFVLWAIQTDDKSYHDVFRGGQVVVDIKRDHGSAFLQSNSEGGYCTIKLKNVNNSLFTRGGFVKFTR